MNLVERNRVSPSNEKMFKTNMEGCEIDVPYI
jgi:hypothetical protein